MKQDGISLLAERMCAIGRRRWGNSAGTQKYVVNSFTRSAFRHLSYPDFALFLCPHLAVSFLPGLFVFHFHSPIRRQPLFCSVSFWILFIFECDRRPSVCDRRKHGERSVYGILFRGSSRLFRLFFILAFGRRMSRKPAPNASSSNGSSQNSRGEMAQSSDQNTNPLPQQSVAFLNRKSEKEKKTGSIEIAAISSLLFSFYLSRSL